MSILLRKGTCKQQVTTEILYTFHVRLIKWWTHPFDSRRRTKLSFVAQWDSGKRSSSTEVKISSNILSGTTSKSKSRNMACLYVPWSRANVIASAVYKQFSSLVERGKIYLQKWGVKIFSVPSVVTIKRANQIGLRVWKNINQSTPEDQILTLSSAWRWDSRPRSPEVFLSLLVAFTTRCRRLCGLLLISFEKKNQEKPLGPGYKPVRFPYNSHTFIIHAAISNFFSQIV